MSRAYCSSCARPCKVCVCASVQRQTNRYPVLVLQHPDELNKPLSTVPLIQMGLSKVAVLNGIQIDRTDCVKYLQAWNVSKPVLLYPRELSKDTPHFLIDFEQDNSLADDALFENVDSIIILDGTWRNTREIILANTWLEAFPTLALQNAGQSRYRIRKAQQDGALATIEALAKVMSYIDPELSAQVLLRPFECMIDMQIECMGEKTFLRNYV